MSTLTVQLPESVKKTIEDLAAKGGVLREPVPRQRRERETGSHADDGLFAPRSRRGSPGGFREIPGRRAGRTAYAGG